MTSKARIKAGNAYTCMVRRCLGKSANYNREIEEHYKDTTICTEWLPTNSGRINFLAWWESQPNSNEEGVSLDKDIGSRTIGSKQYSPSTCALTNKATQMQATRLLKKNNKTGYRGVQVRSDIISTKALKYRAELRVNFKRYNLGSYSTIENAAYAVNHFITSSVAQQPLNIIDMSLVDVPTVLTNTQLTKSVTAIGNLPGCTDIALQ